MPTNNKESSNKLFGNSNILNAKSIDEGLQTAITNNKGEVVLGGNLANTVIKPAEKATDPYGDYIQSLDKDLDYEVPKVSVRDNKIAISAPEYFYNSPMSAQLDTELQSLKGANLSSPEVTMAIQKLNDEIRRAYSTAAIEQSLGWTEEEYNDYKYALQTASYANPMNYSSLITGLDKDGNKQKKTFKDWVKYYRDNYTTKERSDALLASLKSKKPYERIMALILMGGQTNGNNAVYGFDPWEQAGQGVKAAWNQIKKFPEGTFAILAKDPNTKRVEQLNRNLKIPEKAFADLIIPNEEQFENMKNEIRGKSWGELSDKEKAFMLELAVSKEDDNILWGYRDIAVGEEARARAQALKEMSYDNKDVSRRAIETVLLNNSFDKFKKISDNYATWVGYQEDVNKDEEELAKTVLWSRVAQGGGNIAGTISRFLWENAVVQGLTGGISAKSLANPNLIKPTFNAGTGKWYDAVTGKLIEAPNSGLVMNQISDKLGAKMVKSLIKHEILPASASGSRMLQFVANLAGTIPEDIVQTAVDDVLTYRAGEIKNAIDPEEMTSSLLNNLVTMAIFNAAKSGMNALKQARLAKAAAKAQDFRAVLSIDGLEKLPDDISEIKKAHADGRDVDTSGEKVVVTESDGTKKTLDAIEPKSAELVQMKLFDDDAKLKAESPESTKTSIEKLNDLPDSEVESAVAKSGEKYQAKLFDSVRKWRMAKAQAPIKEVLRLGVKNADGKATYVDAKSYMDYNGLKRVSEIPEGLRDVVVNKNSKLGKESNLVTMGELAEETSLLGGLEMDEAGVNKILNDYAALYDEPVTGAEIKEFFNENPDMDSPVISRKTDAEGGETKVASEADARKASLEDGTQMSLLDELVDETAKAENEVTTKVGEDADTTTVRVDTPNGEDAVTVKVYKPKSLSDGLKAVVEPVKASLQEWHQKTLDRGVQEFKAHLEEFHNKFGDVTPEDFNFVRYNIETLGKKPEEIIGLVDPTTRRKITKRKIEAMKWWAEQPFIKEPRLASRLGLGKEGDENILGYLPHTDYDPSTMDYEDVTAGMLWEKSTGKAALGENGEYVGYNGGTFEDYYKTYLSNMLWDAKSKEIAASMLIEDAAMEDTPVDLSPQEALKMVEGQKEINQSVKDIASTKKVEAELEPDTTLKSEIEDAESGAKAKGDAGGESKVSPNVDYDKAEWDEARKQAASDADKVGAAKAIHDNYGPMYYGADKAHVVKQSGSVRQGLDTLGNTMKNTQIVDANGRKMDFYHSGGADLVYAPRNAIDLIQRYRRLKLEGANPNFRDMLIEFIENHSGRKREYAEYIADKWIKKLGSVKGELTVEKAIRSLSGSMKSEAWSRIRRFLTIAKYDEFNPATKKMLNRFLFSHMQTDAIINSSKLSKNLAGALDLLTSMRYRSLFYGNIKNALLQVTELNRYFTSFKWGDVATMAKRLATDEAFRARVNDYVMAVAPMTKELKNDLYGAYSKVASSVKNGKDGRTIFRKIDDAFEPADKIGLAPIEAAETYKNRMMIAALVQEADRLGLQGDEALRHIRNRFERVGLAMDELNQIGFTSNPIARTALFLQNFQVKELGMHLYNLADAWHIVDETGMQASAPKRILEASKYLTKVLGSKMATTLIMARLGYSASQTLGFDPFGLLDNYTGLRKDDMEPLDYFFMSPLFSGGMTSLLADIYFLARKAYEESNQRTISEEAKDDLEGRGSWGVDWPDGTNLIGAFIPGYTAFNRVNQMTDMLDRGWAVSSSGNRMYKAPTSLPDAAMGYLFGRSATSGAQQYNQTYGDNVFQTMGRFLKPITGASEFDPIDTKNYSDWFKGDGNDLQQFNKGLRYFREEKARIIDKYEEVIKDSGSYDDAGVNEAVNSMNAELDDLFKQMERFVDAYEKKNGSITSAMTKQLINVLNTERATYRGTSSERDEKSLANYNAALRKYSELGFPEVGYYSGAFEKTDGTKAEQEAAAKKKTSYKGSPQWQTYTNSTKNLKKEMAAVLEKADERLQPIRKQIQQSYYNALNAGNWDALKAIQYEYLKSFDSVVAPIIALYGNSALDSPEVNEQLRNMLSLSSKEKADLIPSEHYNKNKYGKYQSMQTQSVDVGKWAKQRYRSDLYSKPTALSYSTVGEDIAEIKKLVSNGQNDRARARALQLWARMDNQDRSLSDDEYKWLINFINKK